MSYLDYDDRDEEPRVKVYWCRDRMCGAEDCGTCRGEQAARAYMAKLAEEDAPASTVSDE